MNTKHKLCMSYTHNIHNSKHLRQNTATNRGEFYNLFKMRNIHIQINIIFDDRILN